MHPTEKFINEIKKKWGKEMWDSFISDYKAGKTRKHLAETYFSDENGKYSYNKCIRLVNGLERLGIIERKSFSKIPKR